MPHPDRPIALVLAGGSALGAYEAGVYEMLHGAGWLPGWISGASIGAVTGALIAGNAPDQRLDRLRGYWRPGLTQAAGDGPLNEWRRTMAVTTAIMTGRADLFGPRNPIVPAWPFGNPEPPSLFDTTLLGSALAKMVDWDLLNSGSPRFTAAAVDVETGEDVIFDTAHMRLTSEHVRASGAMLPAFPPVDLEGRLLGDAGLSANLPLDAVLEGAEGRLLVIAVDLLPLAAPRPRTLTDVASRLQDLNFAIQSRRAIEGWRRLYAERLRGPDAARVPAVTLIHLIYADQGREVVGKALDFSPDTIRDRWDTGARDAAAMLARVDDGIIPLADTPGLHVHRITLREERT